MLLDVPYRRVGSIDTHALLEIVAKLGPLYEAADAPLWSTIAQRMTWVGQVERPTDVAFRKMAPTGYAQLCITNDEVPRAPWAIDVPDTILSPSERAAITADLARHCELAYGPGTIFLLVFAVLAPGGEIPSHRDLPHDVNKRAYSHRLHVPLTEAGDAEYTLKGETVRFEAGGLYEIDNMSPHSVVHRGVGHRVSVVIDYCPAANLEKRNAPSPPKVPLAAKT